MAVDIYEFKWTKDQLWKGCMLATIAHAIMVAHFPELSNEQSWDGMNYNIQDSGGTRGTITFHPEYCVAAFRNDKSNRVGMFNSDKYFEGSPLKIFQLAETETLQFLLDKINGKTLPVITTSFWENENKLLTKDTLEEFVANGGHLLEKQLMDLDSAIKAWNDYYKMTDEQTDLLKSVYERKIARPTIVLSLSNAEIEMIGTDDEDRLDESKVSFEEIGIKWE